MSDVLESIVQAKKMALDGQKKRKSIRDVEKEALAHPQAPSLVRAISIEGELSIIAEMKRQSPSAGDLTGPGSVYDPSGLAREYESSGARALSVLTEEYFFKGSEADLLAAKKAADLPILRKDFILDPYQVFESKILGASAILLIVACLEARVYEELYRLARDLGLDVLVEVHSEKELDVALRCSPDCIGINNRNLKSLETDVRTTFDLFGRVPKGVTVVSESGIKDAQTVRNLRQLGVGAALIGESILKSRDRGKKLQEFVQAGRN